MSVRHVRARRLHPIHPQYNMSRMPLPAKACLGSPQPESNDETCIERGSVLHPNCAPFSATGGNLSPLPHTISAAMKIRLKGEGPDRGHSSIFAPWTEYGQSPRTPPTPQSGIGTIRKLTFQSASWVRWLPGRNLPCSLYCPGNEPA